MLSRISFVFQLLAGVLLFVSRAGAQDSLRWISSHQIKGTSVYADLTDQAYVLTRNQVIMKFNPEGDSISRFAYCCRGEIAYLDVSNPMSIMAWIPDQRLAVFLDRTLQPVGESLISEELGLVSVAALAPTGQIWVYSETEEVLMLIDRNSHVISKSNPVSPYFEEISQPCFLQTTDDRIYMGLSNNQILIFDAYGNFLQSCSPLELHACRFSAANQTIRYVSGNELYEFSVSDRNSSQKASLPVSQIIGASIGRKRLFVLTEDSLVVFE